MARIFITTTAQRTKWEPYALSNFERVLRAADESCSTRHAPALSAADADCVLFVGSHLKFHGDVFRSALYRAHRAKSILFDLQDNAIPRIPGLYFRIPARLKGVPIYEGGFYPRVFNNAVLHDAAPFAECVYLFSFVGNPATSPAVRRRVLHLRHSRALLREASTQQSDSDCAYADVVSQSKFVLCPRGLGPSTWRLFEAMRSGRAPVIISDEWIEPKGLDWTRCSVRVREADIERLPQLLESREGEAESLGRTAREMWEKYFSRTGSFDWIAEACMRIQGSRDDFKRVERRPILAEAMHSLFRYSFAREHASRIVQQLGVKRL